MPDLYTTITEADAATIEQVATAMEISAADPQHLAMIDAYLADLDPAPQAEMLEIGCGTGAIGRRIADRLPEASITGVDPSPGLVAKAAELASGAGSIRFEVADGAALPFGDESFDVVVLHRVLCHVPDPARVLREARRVLRRSGKLLAFDGDYATITVSTGDGDPLASCVAAFLTAYVNDPWLVRRLTSLIRSAGLSPGPLRSHGVIQVDRPDYLLSVVDRGADVLASGGRVGPALAAELKAEARRRVAEHVFFGHIAYASVVALRDG